METGGIGVGLRHAVVDGGRVSTTANWGIELIRGDGGRGRSRWG